MVSERGQSQAASMWELPARSILSCARRSCSGGVDGRGGGFDGGEQIGAWGGQSGKQVGGGDDLLAEVVDAGAGCVEGFDAEADAGEALVVDGVEELYGDENLIARVSGLEEDDGLEVVAERDAAAIEVDDLWHGPVGVGVKLEPDARAGDVIAVEGLGDLDGAAEPDGVFGRRGAAAGLGRDERPGGVVECGRLAVGDVAGVEAPLAGGERVEGLQRVQFGQRGG